MGTQAGAPQSNAATAGTRLLGKARLRVGRPGRQVGKGILHNVVAAATALHATGVEHRDMLLRGGLDRQGSWWKQRPSVEGSFHPSVPQASLQEHIST